MSEETRRRVMPYGEPVPAEEVNDLLPSDVLTLEVARSIAGRANPDVHAAVARLEAALARIDEAKSYYFPNLVLTHNSTRTFHTPANRNRLSTALQATPFVPVDSGDQTPVVTTLLNAIRRPLFGTPDPKGDTNSYSEHSTSFTTSWTLFDGFAREARLLAAKQVHEASEYALSDVQRLIVQAVDAAYHQVQLAEEQVRIAEADADFSTDQFEETQKLNKAGRAGKVDVDNFRVRLLAAQANVVIAAGARETGRVVLAELMGVPGAALPPTLALSPLEEETEEELTAPDADQWIEDAMKRRPDLRQLNLLLESEDQNTRIARALRWPTITASGSWGYDRSSNIHYTFNDQSSAAAIEIRWELLTAGRRDARIRAAQAIWAEAAAGLNRRRLTVESEVRQAVIDVTNAQQQIGLQRANLEIAMETRRMVTAGYRAGKENLTRVNEAQRDVITADAELARARVRLRQAWSDLRAATGVTPESDDDAGP